GPRRRLVRRHRCRGPLRRKLVNPIGFLGASFAGEAWGLSAQMATEYQPSRSAHTNRNTGFRGWWTARGVRPALSPVALALFGTPRLGVGLAPEWCGTSVSDTDNG